MTEQELKAIRELVYAAGEVAYALMVNPNKASRLIAGEATDPESELARLQRALQVVGPLVFDAYATNRETI